MHTELQNKLQNLVDSHHIVLFMKGNRQQPNCGFSARVVSLLDSLDVEYQTYDVFSDPDIRNGMKEFSQWPTFPQLYINKEFLGGCDIITEMYQSGELQGMLGVHNEITLPTITCSDTILNLFRQSIQQYGGGVHLDISPEFQYDISIGPKQAHEHEVLVDGVAIYVSRGTAKRANGLHLDYAEGENGGVIINNPNEATVQDLSVEELAQWLTEKKDFILLDVRQPHEVEVSKISGSVLYDAQAQQDVLSLPKDHTIVLHCRSGARSLRAGKDLVAQGYTNVYNVVGGINEWATKIDTSLPVY